MDTKKITIGVLVVAVAVFAFLAFKSPTAIKVPTTITFDATQFGAAKAPVVNVPSPVVNVAAPNVTVRPNITVEGNSSPSAPTLGALASPDLPYPYFSFGGVRRFAARSAMRAATTTLCAIQAPTATSTIVSAAWRITTGTSTAATIDMGTSTTAYATTTNLVSATSVASGAQGSAYWSPTGGAVDDAKMAPSEWVVFKTAGAGLGGYTYTGTCQAVFEVF